jgi:hypothetical protein
MIKTVLRMNGARFYEVHAPQVVKNPTTGAKGKAYSYLTQVFACILPAGSSFGGMVLQATQDAGDVSRSDFDMFSREERFEKERILYKGIFYDIRSVKPYDNGILKFYKSSLIKVDNHSGGNND